MTELGRMLVEEGKEEAKLEVAKNLIDILNDETIASRVGIDIIRVKELREESLTTQNC